jgi:hypothetical protein
MITLGMITFSSEVSDMYAFQKCLFFKSHNMMAEMIDIVYVLLFMYNFICYHSLVAYMAK